MDKNQIEELALQVRKTSPLVHNITNFVVMNFTANALLALGASPVMAHAVEEVEDMTALSGALVVNIGTLSVPWVEAMRRSARRAISLGKPYVLDPVGAGATPFRNEVLEDLIGNGTPTVIRGNASEIMAVAKDSARTKGVDSTETVAVAKDSAQALAERLGCVVCVSGAKDWITDGQRSAEIARGTETMARVTGMGCVSTALIGAFCAVAPAFEGTLAAMTVMGVCGEIAERESRGPGSFASAFLDVLHHFKGADV